jgi:hypothetical protein
MSEFLTSRFKSGFDFRLIAPVRAQVTAALISVLNPDLMPLLSPRIARVSTP